MTFRREVRLNPGGVSDQRRNTLTEVRASPSVPMRPTLRDLLRPAITAQRRINPSIRLAHTFTGRGTALRKDKAARANPELLSHRLRPKGRSRGSSFAGKGLLGQIDKVNPANLNSRGRAALAQMRANPRVSAMAVPRLGDALRAIGSAWMNVGKTVKPGAGPIGGSGRSLASGSLVMATKEITDFRNAMRPARTKRRLTMPKAAR